MGDGGGEDGGGEGREGGEGRGGGERGKRKREIEEGVG